MDRDVRDVQKKVAAVEDRQNLFDLDSTTEELINTGKVAFEF